MSAGFWIAVPLVPLVAWGLALRWPQQVAPYLWLCCLPALVAALVPPGANLPLPGLWPGAEWGGADPLSRAFLGFSAFLWGCATLFASGSTAQDAHARRFWSCWLLALTGNLLLIIARDAGSFYVGFTLMSLSAYGLVVHLGGPAPRQAGRLYLQLAVLGEMLLYGALMLRVHEAGGSASFTVLQNTPIGAVTASLLLVGFGLKAGFWPLHVWLPLAHPAAPPAASAVLSGAMIKAGILGLWRFMPEHEPLPEHWAHTLFVIGLFSAFFGVALGLIQRTAKAALAYSSISQVGYLLAILAAAWLSPGQTVLWAALLAFYVVHHGMAKGALFMGAGLAARTCLRPWHWVLLVLPAFALAGLPFTSGGAVKLLFKNQLADTALYPLSTLLTIGSLGTALLVMRILWLMRPSTPRTAPPKRRELVAWLLPSLMPLLLPWFWPDLRGPLFASLTPVTLMTLLWPLAVASAMGFIVARWGRFALGSRALPNPSRYLSLLLKRRLQRPPLPPVIPAPKQHIWRARERSWNRFWNGDTLKASTGLVLMLLLGLMLLAAL